MDPINKWVSLLSFRSNINLIFMENLLLFVTKIKNKNKNSTKRNIEEFYHFFFKISYIISHPYVIKKIKKKVSTTQIKAKVIN